MLKQEVSGLMLDVKLRTDPEPGLCLLRGKVMQKLQEGSEQRGFPDGLGT